MVKIEQFQCSSERRLPGVIKTQPTFAPTVIFGGVMASQTCFGTPCISCGGVSESTVQALSNAIIPKSIGCMLKSQEQFEQKSD